MSKQKNLIMKFVTCAPQYYNFCILKDDSSHHMLPQTTATANHSWLGPRDTPSTFVWFMYKQHRHNTGLHIMHACVNLQQMYRVYRALQWSGRPKISWSNNITVCSGLSGFNLLHTVQDRKRQRSITHLQSQPPHNDYGMQLDKT